MQPQGTLYIVATIVTFKWPHLCGVVYTGTCRATLQTKMAIEERHPLNNNGRGRNTMKYELRDPRWDNSVATIPLSYATTGRR